MSTRILERPPKRALGAAPTSTRPRSRSPRNRSTVAVERTLARSSAVVSSLRTVACAAVRPLITPPTFRHLSASSAAVLPPLFAGRPEQALVNKKRETRLCVASLPPRLLPSDPSRLEQAVVKEPTRQEYARRLRLFREYCVKVGRQDDALTMPLEALESLLLDYFDENYLTGASPDWGTKLVASLGYFRPSLYRTGGTHLNRVRRALAGWNRVAPLTSRLPVPWAAVCGIVVQLLVMNFREEALAVVLAFDAYLRPGELLALTSQDVVPARPAFGKGYARTALLLCPAERGRPSKTFQFDDSVMLDSPDRLWLGPLIEAQALARASTLLFPFTARVFYNRFVEAA